MTAAYLAAPQLATPMRTGPYQCVGKVRFASPMIAQAVIARKAPNVPGLVYRHAYRCDFCGHWHIGTRRSHAPQLRKRSHDTR